MNINDINHGTQRAEPLRAVALDKTAKAGAETQAREAQETKAATKPDTLEISKEARVANTAREEELLRDIAFARRALYSIPPLSKERAEELVESLEKGVYNAPDVLFKLSESLAEEIMPSLPKTDGETA